MLTLYSYPPLFGVADKRDLAAGGGGVGEEFGQVPVVHHGAFVDDEDVDVGEAASVSAAVQP